jgi:hypothetical protein
MSAADALKAARVARIELVLDGDDLVLEASTAPPAAVFDALARHKAEIVALLRPGEDGWTVEDWRVFFEERAGIVKFDCGLRRGEAEAQAFACCVVEWLNHNPARSPSGSCLACGNRQLHHQPLLPYGCEPTGHGSLHSLCWSAWFEARQAKAVAALTAMGIPTPVDQSMEQKQQSGLLPSYGNQISSREKAICLPEDEWRRIHVEHYQWSAITGGTHPRRSHPETIRGSSRCSRTRGALLGTEGKQSADIDAKLARKDRDRFA